MGSVGIDLKTKEHRLETEYPLETPHGVFALLSNIHHIRSSAIDKGDYDAINLLIDFEIAYSKVRLTERQKEVVKLVFMKGYTQQEAATKLGIARQTVHQIVWNVVNKVSQQYEKDLNDITQGGDDHEHDGNESSFE